MIILVDEKSLLSNTITITVAIAVAIVVVVVSAIVIVVAITSNAIAAVVTKKLNTLNER